MQTLPIFKVVGQAVWFEIANLFTLFRLTWLPIVLLVAAEYGVAYGLVAMSPEKTLEGIGETRGFFIATVAVLILQGLALSVVAVAVHRIVLFGDRRTGQYFAFPFGRTELLYVLMGALTFTITIAIFGIVIGGLYTMMGGATHPSDGVSHWFRAMAGAAADKAKNDPMQMLGIILGMIVAYIFAFWILLRLTVWPPAVVANNRLSLGEAWRLTKDQAWARLGLMIASSLPLLLAIVVLSYAAYTAKATGLLSSFELVGNLGAKVEYALKNYPNADALWMEFAYDFLVTTYTVAILSFAYRALKGLDDGPIDQHAGGEGGLSFGH